MRKFLSTLLLFLLLLPVSAQAETIAQMLERGFGLFRQGDFEKAAELFVRASDVLELKHPDSKEYRYTAYYYAGYSLRELGRFTESVAYFEGALNIARGRAESTQVVPLLTFIGDAFRLSGKGTEAVKYYEEALGILSERGDESGGLYLRYNLADVSRMQGKYDSALKQFEEVLSVAFRLGMDDLLVATRTKMADTRRLMGQHLEALRTFEIALVAARDRKMTALILENLLGMARTSLEMQNKDAARRFFEEALSVARNANNTRQAEVITGHLSELYRDMKKFDSAIEVYAQQLKEAEAKKDMVKALSLRSQIAGLYAKNGDFESALKMYAEALEQAKGLSMAEEEVAIQENLGDLYVAKGAHDMALERYLFVKKEYEEAKDMEGVAGVSDKIASVYLTLGRFAEAEKEYNDILASLDADQKSDATAELLRKLGGIREDSGDVAGALGYYERALELNEDSAVILKMAELEYASGMYQEARQHFTTLAGKEKGQVSLNQIARAHLGLADLEVKAGAPGKSISLYIKAGFEFEGQGDLLSAAIAWRGAGEGYLFVKKESNAIKYLRDSIRNLMTFRSDDPQKMMMAFRELEQTYRSLLSAYVKSNNAGGFVAAQGERYAEWLGRTIDRSDERKNTFSLQGVQRLLDANTVLLSYSFVTSDGGKEYPDIAVAAVTQTQAVVKVIPAKALVNAVRAAFPDAFDNSQSRRTKLFPERAGRPVDENTAYRVMTADAIRVLQGLILKGNRDGAQLMGKMLYRHLIAPVEQIIAGKGSLLVVPGEPLAFVPVETFRNEKGKYLAEIMNVRYGNAFYRRTVVNEYTAAAGSHLLLNGTGVAEKPVDHTVANASQMWKLYKESVSKLDTAVSAQTYADLGLVGLQKKPSGQQISLFRKSTPDAEVIQLEQAGEDEVVRKLALPSDVSQVVTITAPALFVPGMPELSAVIVSEPQGKSDGMLRSIELAKIPMANPVLFLTDVRISNGIMSGGTGLELVEAMMYGGARSVVVNLSGGDELFISNVRDILTKSVEPYNDVAALKRDYIAGKYGEAGKNPAVWGRLFFFGL